MKPSRLASLCIAALAAHAAAAPRPLDAEGACPAKRPTGHLARAQRPGSPAPMSAATADAFRAAHRAGTAGEDPWLRDLTGKAGAMRTYRETGVDVLIVTVCDADDCDRHRAYVAFDPRNAEWGATVIEGGHLRELVQGAPDTTLAMHPPALARALVCAINTDAGNP